MVDDWGSDEDLLAALADGWQSAGPVATGPVAGRLAWERSRSAASTDASLLARLDFDSALVDPLQAGAVRSGSAQLARTLGFSADGGGLELAVQSDSMVGQVLPPRAGTAALQCGSGAAREAPVDEIGCFELPIPYGPFRVCFSDVDGVVQLTTEWTRL